ncbi:hypothetical protein DB354_00340 [Opitutus sp. ER46]|nr:hypothetical protein DB354_00340 [Opitutus sp. ER46]
MIVAPVGGGRNIGGSHTMTPHEKAVNAINARLERLQANLVEAKDENTQRMLFEAILVTIALAEGLNDYIAKVGAYAQRRHATVKEAHTALIAQHNTLLESGRALLEQYKANPADSSLRKEIDLAQQRMESIQTTVRRGANALQRELAPGIGLIDPLAGELRRFAEADQPETLKRLIPDVIEHVRELYSAHPLPAKGLIDAADWAKVVAAEFAQVTEFYDLYARAGYQIILAFELLALALADEPPQSAEETTRRANEALVARLKSTSARLHGAQEKD